MSNEHNVPGMTPPVEWTGLPAEEPVSTWPKTIGIISLIYACLGMLCGGAYLLSAIFSKSLMAMAGMDVPPMPGAMLAVVVGSLVAVVVLGIYMFMGSVVLLRRRRSGVKMLKTWAILRVVVVMAGAAAGVLTLPSTVQWTMQVEQAAADMARKNGQTPGPQRSEQEIRRTQIISTAVVSGIVLIYPIFITFYLGRRRITNEVDQWP